MMTFYCEENGIKCDITSVKLGVRMTNLNIDGITNDKGAKGIRLKKPNTKKLQTHFGSTSLTQNTISIDQLNPSKQGGRLVAP